MPEKIMIYMHLSLNTQYVTGSNNKKLCHVEVLSQMLTWKSLAAFAISESSFKSSVKMLRIVNNSK